MERLVNFNGFQGLNIPFLMFRFSTLSRLMEKQSRVLRIPMPEPSRMSKCLQETTSFLQQMEATQT